MPKIQASKNVIKVAQALGFLLALDENHKMERVKLIKLLWAADRFHLRKYGRTISDADDYYAMVHGPVCSLALDIAQMNKDKNALSDQDIAFLEEHFTANDIETSMQKEVGDDYLSETDKEALRKAWETFKDKDAFDLADKISHLYPEWSKHAKYFRQNSGRRPIDVIDFFDNPKEDKYFAEDQESIDAAKQYYLENKDVDEELSRIFGA